MNEEIGTRIVCAAVNVKWPDGKKIQSGNEHYDYHVNKRPITANECVLSRMFDLIRSLK